jgi:predicted membrane chloride channel (bestrophin family)
MATIKDLATFQGGSERIKNTPLMRHYSWFTTAFVWLFLLLLPFCFVDLGWKMIPLVVVVSAIFVMLDRAGTFTETPFSNNFNMVWHDEFDGDRLGEAKWTYRPDGKRKGGWWSRKAINRMSIET